MGRRRAPAQHFRSYMRKSLLMWPSQSRWPNRPLAPFAFTGLLRKVTVTMNDYRVLDREVVHEAEMARQ